MTELSDSDLIARTISGDETAYAALVRRHYRAAFAVALANTGGRADAEDVCHDAFIRAATAGVRRADELLHEPAASADDPARAAELGELREQLERALGVLPAVQRE